jgi:hypothetical protein
MDKHTSLVYKLILKNMVPGVSDCCLMPTLQFISNIMAKKSYVSQWDDDEVRFVLDRHTELDFHSASTLKQQSTSRHVAPFRHIIPIPRQPVFDLSP